MRMPLGGRRCGKLVPQGRRSEPVSMVASMEREKAHKINVVYVFYAVLSMRLINPNL
jgi:hypothetical protein